MRASKDPSVSNHIQSESKWKNIAAVDRLDNVSLKSIYKALRKGYSQLLFP